MSSAHRARWRSRGSIGALVATTPPPQKRERPTARWGASSQSSSRRNTPANSPSPCLSQGRKPTGLAPIAATPRDADPAELPTRPSHDVET